MQVTLVEGEHWTGVEAEERSFILAELDVSLT